jgi:cullin-4
MQTNAVNKKTKDSSRGVKRKQSTLTNSNNNATPKKKVKRSIVISDSEEDEEFIDTNQQQRTSSTTTTSQSSSSSAQQAANKSTVSINNQTMSGFTRRRTTAATNGSSVTLNKNRKVLKIKPFTLQTPALPENFEYDTWNKLQDATIAIHENRPIHISQEELYKAVNDMCLHKFEKFLFINLEKVCRENVQQRIFANKLKPALDKFSSDYLTYLSLVSDVWDNYTQQLATIQNIFLYLDRTFIVSNYSSNTPIENMAQYRSLRDMGMQQFRSELLNLRNKDVLDRIISGLLNMIKSEREGDNVEKRILQKVLRMLVSLQVYSEYFEQEFLKQTEKFYSTESQRSVVEKNVPEYLLDVQTRLAQEHERAQSYLFVGTKRPLISCVERECIQKHVDIIIERGFTELIQLHRLTDLSRMYDLFRLVNELEKLKQAFVEYIKKTGESIVNSGVDRVNSTSINSSDDPTESGIEMVDEIFKFKAKIDEILKTCFKDNTIFVHGMRNGFEHFINTRQNQPAEYIAKFIDQKLKSGNKSLNDEELEKVMDDTMVLFKFINGKDVFEAFYKKDLAKRLLLGRSASFDAEKSMISRLRTESGKQFTSKLEGMFRDIDVSRDLMLEFKSSKECQKLKQDYDQCRNIDLNVTVITSGFWPSYPDIKVNLPKYVEPVQTVFERFYLDKHSGRVLKWQNTLGQCSLRAQFPSGQKELQVSLLQASILFLFNEKDEITFPEIKASCGINNEDELQRTLQSLALGKVRVLKKGPKGKDIDDSSTFYYNNEFQHPLIRIRINSIQIRETKQEQSDTTEKIRVERQYATDAAVVRIMKARKQLSHQQLVAEVFKQIKFPIKAVELKKRIETLIEREYIERITVEREDENSAHNCIYKYLA